MEARYFTRSPSQRLSDMRRGKLKLTRPTMTYIGPEFQAMRKIEKLCARKESRQRHEKFRAIKFKSNDFMSLY